MPRTINRDQLIQKITIIANPVYTAYFSGSCGPNNPGGTASFGAVIFWQEECIWEHGDIYHPPAGKERETSNNLADYLGLLEILKQFIERKVQHEHIAVYGDSNLVIRQMCGDWQINGGIYAPFAEEARELCSEFSNIVIKWIPREENTIAKELSKSQLV